MPTLKYVRSSLLWLKADGSPPRFPRAVGGHSTRVGGVTSLAAAGVPPSQIFGCETAVFERFIRCHPTLLQAVLFQGRSVHEPPFPRLIRFSSPLRPIISLPFTLPLFSFTHTHTHSLSLPSIQYRITLNLLSCICSY